MIEIVDFVPGTAKVAEIEPHVADFKPDVVVVDYIEEMHHDSKREVRHQLSQHVRDLSALAKKYNAAVVTAQQLNRPSLRSKTATVQGVSEDIGIGKRADLILTYRPDIPEKLGRILVDAARNTQQGLEVVVTHNFGLCQSVVHSRVVDNHYHRALEAFERPTTEATRADGNRRRPKDEVAARRAQVAVLGGQGLSQTEIAERLGTSQQVISRDLVWLRAHSTVVGGTEDEA